MNLPHGAPKLLLIITRLNIGGPAAHVVSLTRGMKPLGYQTTLVSGVCEAGEGDMGYLLHSDEQVHWIPEMSRSVAPLRNLRALLRLWRLIRRERPDVVHTHTAMAGCLGRLAAFLAGTPVMIHTFHGNSLRGYFSPMGNAFFLRIERLLARLTDVICVISGQQLEELSGELRVAPRSKFHVVPLGLDLAPYVALRPPALDGPTLRVGWLGRLAPVKNIPLLLDIVAATLRKTDRIEFHVAGDGPERDAVQEAVRRHGARLVWHGWQHDVVPFLSQCHVLVQTSINEGTPVALIQGMAAGRPFLSTRAGSVVDMVSGPPITRSHGCAWHSNAALADAEPEAFASALLSLLEDPARLADMAAQAREFACARWRQETLFANLDSLYREVLTGKSLQSRRSEEIPERVS